MKSFVRYLQKSFVKYPQKSFVRYPHLERYGNREVEDINFGEAYVFPKIDGTNGSVWAEEEESGWVVRCGSRNRGLGEESNDNHGFREHVKHNKDLQLLALAFPDWIFYGEWLVPHTFKNYRDDAWHKFYIFDVWSRSQELFVSYDVWKNEVLEYYQTIVPCYKIVVNGQIDDFIHSSKICDFLLKDSNSGPGEGIVIKNYEWKNKFGNQIWAKIVTSEFKEENLKSFNSPLQQTSCIEEIICHKYITSALVEKEYSKIQDLERKSLIPRLLETVFRCLVCEELYNALNTLKIKQPVDFRTLKTFTIMKIKALKPELF